MTQEKRIMVAKLKGLLMGLEDEVRNARFNLAVDNIGEMDSKISEFTGYIDAVNELMWEYNMGITAEGDELY